MHAESDVCRERRTKGIIVASKTTWYVSGDVRGEWDLFPSLSCTRCTNFENRVLPRPRWGLVTGELDIGWLHQWTEMI